MPVRLSTPATPQMKIVMRYFVAFVFLLSLGVVPLVGCSDTVDREVGEQCAYPEGEISPEVLVLKT